MNNLKYEKTYTSYQPRIRSLLYVLFIMDLSLQSIKTDN